MRSAMGYATLILVLAITPVFFVEGLAGAFFQPLAVAYARRYRNKPSFGAFA